jgi:hypothetical protein
MKANVRLWQFADDLSAIAGKPHIGCPPYPVPV